jgi:hypothetical protein
VTAPLIGGVRLVTADDICHAVEVLLTNHLPFWSEAAGLPEVKTWQQLPTPQAISAAAVPAGAITSPGLTEPPTKHRDAYEATWRVVVAIYDRGTDHTDTQGKARTWAALIRTVLVQHPRLDGLALRLTWVGEDYALLGERSSARTLAGCFVAVDVTVADVVPAAAPPEFGGSPTAPAVITTRSTVSVRPPTTSQE